MEDTSSRGASLPLWHTSTSLQHKLPSGPVTWHRCFIVTQPALTLTCWSFRRVTGCPIHMGESSLTAPQDLASTGLRCRVGWAGCWGSTKGTGETLGVTTAVVPMKTGVVDAKPDILKFMEVAAEKEPSGTGERGPVIVGEQTRGKEAKAADGTTTHGTLREGNWLAARLIAPGAWFAESKKLKLLNPKPKRKKARH